MEWHVRSGSIKAFSEEGHGMPSIRNGNHGVYEIRKETLYIETYVGPVMTGDVGSSVRIGQLCVPWKAAVPHVQNAYIPALCFTCVSRV